jgi:hypothetical protein
MPHFTYTGDDPRQFPADDGVNPSLEVSPGEVVEADHNPDPAYFEEAKAKKTKDDKE